MAGGLVKYRHLSRNSAHRRALLRNLVTSLVEHESIHTTYAKAKEAQRMAEKLITIAKRNNETARRQAQSILFTPHLLMPKLFTTLRERYLERAGGYTRVLRTEPKDKFDQGESAILEFVDGKRDMRFHLTAATVARDRKLGQPHSSLTLLNRKKVTQGRKNGDQEFEMLVTMFSRMGVYRWEGPRRIDAAREDDSFMGEDYEEEPELLTGEEGLTEEMIRDSSHDVESQGLASPDRKEKEIRHKEKWASREGKDNKIQIGRELPQKEGRYPSS